MNWFESWGAQGLPEPPDHDGLGDPWEDQPADPDAPPPDQSRHVRVQLELSNFTTTTKRGLKMLPRSAAVEILRKLPVAVAEDGRFWAHWDGVWRAAPGVVRYALAGSMGNEYRPDLVKGVEDILRTMIGDMTVAAHPEYINLRNGMIRSTTFDRFGAPSWADWEKIDHRPQVHSTVQLPHQFSTTALCPEFDKYLAGSLTPEGVLLAWEIIAACIYSGIPAQRAVMLQGPPGCGKSQFLDVITGLIGEGNATHIPLQNLADRFNVAQLHGKALNVHADLDQAGIGETGTFKTMVTGDSLTAEHKGQNPFQFTPFATLLFSANTVPPSDDRSGAFTRRWVVLPFLPPGADRAKVRDIGKRVLLAEAEGIIRKAIPYLQELLHRGDFCVIPEAQDAFEKKTDFMRVFIEDELIFDGDAITPTRALSNALRRWRADAGHEHSRVTVAHLEPLLVEKGAGKITNNKIEGKSVKSVRGVRLTNPWKGQAT